MRQKDALFIRFMEWGFDMRAWQPTTRNRYSRRVRAADAWLVENRNISVLFAKEKDLKAYLFATPPSPRNRNQIRQALVAFGEFLVDAGIAQSNVALGLPRLPEPSLLPKALESQPAHRIQVAAKQFGPMIETLVLCLLFAGLRRNEARLLEWRQVDEGWLHFSGKGSKERSVPLAEPLAQALRRWKAQCSDPRWVFPSSRREGHPFSERHMYELVREVGKVAGVQLHPHLCRHTAATRLLETGADLRTVQEFLGHSSPKTTAIYLKIRPPMLKEAVERLTYDDGA